MIEPGTETIGKTNSPTPIGIGVGQVLRQRRQQKNLTIEIVSQETHIHSKFLKALEDERWDEFPARVYLQGFLRQYAIYLGLEGEEQVRQYRAQAGEMEKPAISRQSPDEERSSSSSQSSSAPVVALSAIIGAFVLGGVVFLLSQNNHVPEPPVRVEQDPSASAPFIPSSPNNQGMSRALGAFEFQLRARETAWIRVWIDGNLRFEGTVPSGLGKSWPGKKRFRVQTPDMNALDVLINGVPQSATAPGEFLWVADSTPIPVEQLNSTPAMPTNPPQRRAGGEAPRQNTGEPQGQSVR